ncbi:MAG: efflux RND transporter periplasmic adaptor subunit [Firmicutes bacterium]|nr:efflux RND transporter periplasmic adaptor subunit [Bacillota bacterium]
MKKIAATGIIVLVLAGIALAMFGWDVQDTVEESVKPVKIIEVFSEIAPVVLDYIGTVSPGEVRQLGFKSPGKIAGVYVVEGESVKKGDMLAALDTKELLHARESANEDLKSARSALEFSQSVFQRMEELYREGAVSQQDLEKAILDKDLRQASYSQATVNMENIQSSIEDAVLVAGMDAYIVDVLFKEGEMAAAVYPVVVIRNGDLVVNTGLSEGDAAKVLPGAPVKVKAGDREVFGEVVSVDPVPDEDTRTYNAKISLEENSFSIGAVVKLEIMLGEEEGIWIPLTSVMADGEDYVYIVEDERAVRKKVTIDRTRSSRVRVKGLNPGDALVVEGYRGLKDGDRVGIINKTSAKGC